MRTRIAFATLAAAIVGCVAAPSGERPLATSLPDPPVVFEMDRPAGSEATAIVRVAIGSKRQVQMIPPTARAIGLRLRNEAGKNLVRSALCGADAGCYKTGIEEVVIAYSPGQVATASLVVTVERAPVSKAFLEAVAYLTTWNLVASDSKKLATGSSEPIALVAGGTATGSVSLVPLGKPPTVTWINPPIAAESQEVTIKGTGFVDEEIAVEFGNPDALAVPREATVSTTMFARVPASASVGPLRVRGTYGYGTYGAPFIFITSLSLPGPIADLKVGGGNYVTISASARTSSGENLATASAEWGVAPYGWDLSKKDQADRGGTDGDAQFDPKKLPRLEYVGADGKLVAGPSATNPDFPGTVTLSAGTAEAGLYAVWISNGKFWASQSVRIK